MRFRVARRVVGGAGLVLTVWVAVASASPEVHQAAKPATTLVSREGEPPGTTGRGYTASISADGRFVAFSDGLVILVRDLQAGTTELASEALVTPLINGSHDPSISADGRFVAFERHDVFVRDLQADTTTLASPASGVIF